MRVSANNIVLERGILTSTYKEEIRHNVRMMKKASLYTIKNKIKERTASFYSETGTVLKVSMFALALVFIIF